jgi:hypothetical protein
MSPAYRPPRSPGKLGKRPPDPWRPRLRLARYLTGLVPPYPPAADYLRDLPDWQMLGNDTEGDCVAVTWANLRRLMTRWLGPRENYPGMDQVQAVYETQNAPGEDNGMDIQVLLSYLVRTGGPDGVKALGFAQVDYQNLAEVKAALAIFGALWVGFEVQSANMDQFANGEPWDYVSGSPIDGGHSVLGGGYGLAVAGSPPQLAGDVKFITWAEETSFTDRFWLRSVDECWAVIWPEHLGAREFIEGMNLATFADDYTAITGRPFPAVVPPPPPPDPGPAPEPPPPPPEPTPQSPPGCLPAWARRWLAGLIGS